MSTSPSSPPDEIARTARRNARSRRPAIGPRRTPSASTTTPRHPATRVASERLSLRRFADRITDVTCRNSLVEPRDGNVSAFFGGHIQVPTSPTPSLLDFRPSATRTPLRGHHCRPQRHRATPSALDRVGKTGGWTASTQAAPEAAALHPQVRLQAQPIAFDAAFRQKEQ